ncbi:FtsQ-type POTRA domain-containing protein [candidate division WWE3 bacterium]|nr:FtsQ-type POTRA domain-containing protein [candidate division WWE3 bacterium]
MKSYQFPIQTKASYFDRRSVSKPVVPIVPKKSNHLLAKIMHVLTPILVLLIILLAGYFVVFKLGNFYISDISVEGAKTFVSATDVLELAKNRSYNKNFFTFNIKELQDSLTKNFQGASSVYITKNLPNKIKVKIIERTPIAVVSNGKTQDYFIVDIDGYVLGIVDETKTNLPRILYQGDISVGYFLDKDSLAVYFEVLKAVDIEKLKSSSMSLHSDYLSMYIDDSVEVLIGNDKNIKKSMEVVSQLVTQLKTGGKNIQKIDLRFDKVIVSYR